MKARRGKKANAAESPNDGTETPEENRTASSRKKRFPIVGIGASAGGLAAFEAFFSGMPVDTDPGMAFVLVQHLAPDHKSILTELVRRYTRMQVSEVVDGVKVSPNCAYIIPPNRDMALLSRTLRLTKPSAPRGQRLPIDFFFRSLAQDQHERAICIVLSGTGSDGALGVRAVKGEGGMVMVQSPDSTEYDGMPRSAIATGMVDYVLTPNDMPAALISYAAHAFGNGAGRPSPVLTPQTESAQQKIFILLRNQTGHDFSQYKPTTIHRRIERRMAIHQIGAIDEYVQYLQRAPEETEALFRDLLIGVTRFFRDPEVFDAIEKQVLPELFAGKPAGSEIRIWSPGCSTGEEAYSLAILLSEHQEGLQQRFKVQLFATDIDGQAISTARAGIFPASIAGDISPERLRRFFVSEPGENTFRIRKSIRDMLVFSEQDLIRDPPLSRLDLISCRNILIYMGRDLQKRLISLFHYALKPGRYLLLGTSESVGEFDDLFATLDRSVKLYQRKDQLLSSRNTVTRRSNMPMESRTRPPFQTPEKTAEAKRPSLRQLTERTLLQLVTHSAALVNERGDIHYLHGRTGMYLEPNPGEAGINNILKMAREGLRRELTMALHRCVSEQSIVRRPGLRIKTNGDTTSANLTVVPVDTVPGPTVGVPLYLVVLEDSPAYASHPMPGVASLSPVEELDDHDSGDADARIVALKRALIVKEEYLQTTNEELESSNEELRSSNEEMQSVNEELQSTNEELETSKEELQSLNEELATINAELQSKVIDLMRTNNDMNNLLAGTGIATIFVDHQLRILRFTPATTQIINLIQSDVGRPVGHIVSNLTGYDRLSADTQVVLDTLVPKEIEVQTVAGMWFTLRIRPYRTLENVIEGAVITFVDITEAKTTQKALLESEFRFRQLVESLPQLVWTCNSDGSSDYLSPQWVEFTGVPESEQLGYGWLDQIHPEDQGALTAAWKTAAETGKPIPIEYRIRRHSGDYRWFETRATAVHDADGRNTRWFGVCAELTGRRLQDRPLAGDRQRRPKEKEPRDGP